VANVVFDAAGGAISGAPTPTTVTCTVTIGTLTNGAVGIGIVYYGNTASVSSVSVAGAAATLVTRYNDGAAAVTLELWQFLAPAAGSTAVIVNMAAAAPGGSYLQVFVASGSGVSQSAPIEAGMTTRTVTGAHASQTDALTPANDGAMAFCLTGCVSSSSPTTSQTSLVAVTNGVNRAGMMSRSAAVSPPAATSFSEAWSSSSGASAQMVWAFAPVAAASGAPKILPESLGFRAMGRIR
jgi:hypothetical protein